MEVHKSASDRWTPSWANRCHRQTAVLFFAVGSMIAIVPSPSAVASTILARQTCFCGLLRSAIMASRRSRSAAVTSTTIPVRIAQTLTQRPLTGIRIRTQPSRSIH